MPNDNPYAGHASACNEVFVIGLRNPFRFSFDRQTGDLYIGDVGQDNYEEFNLRAAATPASTPVNFGWVCREGCELERDRSLRLRGRRLPGRHRSDLSVPDAGQRLHRSDPLSLESGRLGICYGRLPLSRQLRAVARRRISTPTPARARSG